MFFPNTLQTARETQKHEFHLCLNRRRRRDGRWARLEDQPEHSAGVRPTEGNIPAHLSHRPERTAQHLLLLQPWSTAAHEPGVPRPSDLLTSSGTRIAWFADHHFLNYCLCTSPLMLVARPQQLRSPFAFYFRPDRIVDGSAHALNGLDQCPNGRKAPMNEPALAGGERSLGSACFAGVMCGSA